MASKFTHLKHLKFVHTTLGYHNQGDGGHRYGYPRVESGGGLFSASQTHLCLSS